VMERNIESRLQTLWADVMGRVKSTNPQYPFHFLVECIKNSPSYVDEEKSILLKKRRKQDEDEVINVMQNIPEDTPMHEVVLGRRFGISAEPISTDISTISAEPPEFHAKSVDQRRRIENALSQYAIFTHLDSEDKKLLLDAMREVQYNDGDIIIKEGEDGDNFYVIEDGLCDLYKGKEKIGRIGKGASFGEYALLYNCKRRATVKAIGHVKLFAIDRMTYRKTLMMSTRTRRQQFYSFLDKVPLLQTMSEWERENIADVMQVATFRDNEVIMTQGDIGDKFYIIMEGQANVYNSSGQLLGILRPSDYFGELALLDDRPRAATVIAKGPLKCAVLTREAFNRILGPYEEVLRRNTHKYSRTFSGSE